MCRSSPKWFQPYRFDLYIFILLIVVILLEKCPSFTQLNIIVLLFNIAYCMCNLLLWFKTFFLYILKWVSGTFRKGEGLQWKGEDLQGCKPSPFGRSAMLQIFRGGLHCNILSGGKFSKGEGLQYKTGALSSPSKSGISRLFLYYLYL